MRLSPDEVAAVQRIADESNLPASTLVRSWIVERINAEPAPDLRRLIHDEVRFAIREALARPS